MESSQDTSTQSNNESNTFTPTVVRRITTECSNSNCHSKKLSAKCNNKMCKKCCITTLQECRYHPKTPSKPTKSKKASTSIPSQPLAPPSTTLVGGSVFTSCHTNR